MKLIGKTSAYIEKKDLSFIPTLPQCMYDEAKVHENSSESLTIFHHPDSISFLNKLSFIPNYDVVRSYSRDELENRIASLKREIESYDKEYSSSSSSRKKVLDHDYMRRYTILTTKYAVNSLESYLSNPNQYDALFSVVAE